MAASLPDSNSIPATSVCTVTVSPGSRPIEVPSTRTISSVTVISFCGMPLSRATSAVIILVVLAIGNFSCSLRANNTSCVSATMRIQACAEISVGCSCAAAKTVPRHRNSKESPNPKKHFLHKSTTCHIQEYAGGD